MPDEFDKLRIRRLSMLTGTRLDTSLAEVKSALASLETSARQHQNTMQRSPKRKILWQDLAHMNPFSNAISSQYLRLRTMALAWGTPGQRLYRSRKLLADIQSGLAWMDENDFTAHSVENGNWYDFEISAPQRLTDILVVLGDEISIDRRRRYLRPAVKFDADPDRIDPAPDFSQLSTGANRADKSLADLLEGVLLKDADKITQAVEALKTLFRTVKTGDGYYRDGSFIFHGFFPYNGNYGLVLLTDIADLLYLLQGSRWHLAESHLLKALHWARRSFVPLMYRGAMMDMVRGRLIAYSSSPSHLVGHEALATLLRLSQTARAGEAAAIRRRLKLWFIEDTSCSYATGLPLDLISQAHWILQTPSVVSAKPRSLSHVFASMDRAAHMRPGFAVGIAMHSTRIQNFECINGSDTKGWHTSDGMLFLYDSDLLQFDGDFWPTADPECLPGTTLILGSRPEEGKFGGSSAVGGTTLGRYGAVMMQLSPFGGQLHARKSWFLFDHEVVALGADINSKDPRRPVRTVIENRKLPSKHAPALVRGPGGRWANLPASPGTSPIGYFFPDQGSFKATRGIRTGSWNDIDTGESPTMLSACYQMISINHGAKPSGARYAYVLLPGMDAEATKSYAANPAVHIIENSAAAQAVSHPALGITAVNFWKPGKSVAGITADAVCSVIVRRTRSRLRISVSDPTQAHTGTIHVTIQTPVLKTVFASRGIRKIERHRSSVKLSIHAAKSAGKPFRTSFSVRPDC
jgi:hyaluronate lyase